MKRERQVRKSKTAAELLRELENDPGYSSRMREVVHRRSQSAARYKQAAEPILADLAAHSVSVQALGELTSLSEQQYKSVLPILLRWLPSIANNSVKEELVRAISIPWAAPTATPILMAELKGTTAESSAALRWAIANALAVITDDSVGDQLVTLARDAQYGKAREMLVLALGNCRESRVAPTLIELLSDEQVVGHAVMALGRLESTAARPSIVRLLLHPKGWVRTEAAKALAAIDGASKSGE